MKKKAIIIILVGILFSFLQTNARGCSEYRDLPFFNEIRMKGIGHVHIKLGDEQMVRIEADDDVISEIKTKVRGDVLEIYLDDAFPEWVLDPEIDIYIVLKELKGIDLGGVGKISSEGNLQLQDIVIRNTGVGSIFLVMQADNVYAELAGLGKITVEGNANYNECIISGAGKIDAKYLKVKEAKVRSTGVGSCLVDASDFLDVEITGLGTVSYRSDPELKRKITGIGNLVHLY